MHMQELVSHRFEDGNIPADWAPQGLDHTYERGGMRSGRSTQMMIPLPGPGWRRVRVEIELEAMGGAIVDCGEGVFTMALKVKEAVFTGHCAVRHASVIAQSAKPVPDRSGLRQVVFEFEPGQIRGLVDGEEYISARDLEPKPLTGWIMLAFWSDCLVRTIRILGAEPLQGPLYPIADADKASPSKRKSASNDRDFFLDMAVDFYDDWWPDDCAEMLGERIPYTRAMYEEFFAQLKRCGVKRIPWNYHDLIETNLKGTTEDDIGDNFALAIELAHKNGMQLFGTIKPFETQYFAKCSREQPGLLMARKPSAWGESPNKSIHRIDLVKNDERTAAFSVADVTLLVSDDNKNYVPYAGAIQREEVIEDYPIYEHTASGARKTNRTRRSRVLRLSGLNIPESHIVVRVASTKWSFSNSLVNLIHLFGEKGEETRLTYGTASNTEEPFVAKGGLDAGILYDCCIGTPTAHLGVDAVREPHLLDSGQNFLGVRRSKGQFLHELGSPSYPEVHEWWLTWVRAIIDAGADGVEIRRTAHNSTFTWSEFGFEPPVRNEYLKRTGVDLWTTDDFDKELWRRIRGEGYTEFYRKARAITRRAGKTLGVHIDGVMEVEPGHVTAMDIHWDWRTWIKEDLADYVLLKGVWPGSRFMQEIISLARPRGIDVVVSLFEFSSQWKKPGSEMILDGRLRAARDAGCDGYQFYDSAALLRALPDTHRVVVKNPAMRDVLRKYFCPR